MCKREPMPDADTDGQSVTVGSVYPAVLLPKPEYARHIDLASLYAGRQFYTQRRADCPQDDCVDEFGNVTEMALGVKWEDKDSIIGMSVNMMGTPHRPEHGKWLQINPGSKHWDGKAVDISNYAHCHSFHDEQVFVYVNASALEGSEIPYTRMIPNREVYEKYKGVPGVYGRDFSKATSYDMTGTVRHMHQPTFLNYWHAEIWITHVDGSSNDPILVKDLKESPEWKNKLKRSFVEIVRVNSVGDLPVTYDIITGEWYLAEPVL